MKQLTLTLAALALMATQSVLAVDTVVWQGSGAVLSLEGIEQETYSLVIENIKVGSQTQTEVTVSLSDGSLYNQQCQFSENKDGSWESDCSTGQGGGRCVGDNLCLDYIEDSSGRGFATTIIFDGPKDMRMLRTELKNGKAVRFFREKLQRR